MPLGVALIVALLAQAAVPLDEDPDFVRAQELYSDLEFEQAIFLLERAALAEGRTSEERARVFAWLGLCHLQARSPDLADRFFGMAVDADAGVQLPAFAPPTVVEALDDKRAEVLKRAAAEQAPADSTSASTSTPTPTTTTTTTTPTSSTGSGEEPSQGAGEEAPVSYGLLAAGGAAAAGAMVLLAGGLVAGLALPNVNTALDPDAFQRDAVDAARIANGQLALSGALVASGAVLVLGGGVLGALSWE